MEYTPIVGRLSKTARVLSANQIESTHQRSYGKEIGGINMKKQIEFGPMVIYRLDKEENGIKPICSSILVENGPPLMDNYKNYSRTFNKIIEKHPSIMNVVFYDSIYTTYKINVKGRRDTVIAGIKEILLAEWRKRK